MTRTGNARRFRWGAITLAACLLCRDAPGATGSSVSSKGTYLVTWQVLGYEEVPLNQDFDIDIKVLRQQDRQPAELTVTVDAAMPMHNHGMNAGPQMVRRGPGHWLARGMNLFMPGEWRLLFDLSDKNSPAASAMEFAASTIKLAESEPFEEAAQVTSDEARQYLALFAYQNVLPDTTNIYASDPPAARLGEALFSEPRLSGSGKISCASCHQPSNNWIDGRPHAVGVNETSRNTPTLWNVSHRRWFFWDGRAATLWAQALAPIEAPSEMAGHRDSVLRLLRTDDKLQALYADAFGVSAKRTSVNATFANVGKALAAFETTLTLRSSRFDRFLSCLDNAPANTCRQLRASEVKGLRLFTGRAGCVNCHHGRDLTDDEFHDILLPRDNTAGRNAAIRSAKIDPFGPTSKFSDDRTGAAARHVNATRPLPQWEHAFRTPSLRQVTLTAPYMHSGIYADLPAVLRHYSTLSDAPANCGRGDPLIHPLQLTTQEMAVLSRFLNALTSD